MSSCSGGASDRKIACESSGPPQDDLPPESFWLSKDAEFDWFDRNAFYERSESTKGNSNPNPSRISNSSSRRYSVRAKPSIIGLPKTQKTNYVENRKKNCKAANVRLFPKRTGSANKRAVQLAEPSSPKVSCMGRVRSKRKNRNRSEPVRVRSTGICKLFLSLFLPDKRSVKGAEKGRAESSVCKPVRVGEFGDEPEPYGLGGMKRLSSGRRSLSSAADVAEWLG